MVISKIINQNNKPAVNQKPVEHVSKYSFLALVKDQWDHSHEVKISIKKNQNGIYKDTITTLLCILCSHIWSRLVD